VLDSATLHYVEDSAEAAAFVEWCRRPRRVMAVDTETTGLERDARIRLIQFGDDTDAWTLRWDRWKGTALEGLEVLKRARQRLAFHNSPYDVPKIERQTARDGDAKQGWGFKFDWGTLEDCMILSRLAHPLGSHALKALCSKYVDPRSRLLQNVLSDAMSANGWTWATVPYDFPAYNLYAGADCILTSLLLPELEKMSYSEELYRVEMITAEACIAMSEAGMEVDLWYCKEQIEQLEQELDDLKNQGHERHAFTAFGSNQMFINKMHDYGVYWQDRTPKGAVSTDKEVMERLIFENAGAPAGDLANLTLGHRQRLKLKNTYFRNFLLEAADGDGRVHPDINSIEAVTSRMTVTKPAMQTIPRGPRARRAFRAGAGRYLILADYAQIEPRLLGHFCQDPALLEAIASGDLHTASARMIYQDDTITEDDPRRQPAKSSVLAVIYGAGPEKFAHTAGLPVAEGAAFMERYHGTFPLVKPFLQNVQTVGRRRKRQEGSAYVVTPSGRRLEMRKVDAEYTLVNYLIQGTAADVFKQAIARMWQGELGQHMRLPVHDECIFEVPNDVDPEEFKREASKAMEDDGYRVPLVVEATGPFQNWADKYGAPPT
jgi:DNA polymerase-1